MPASDGTVYYAMMIVVNNGARVKSSIVSGGAGDGYNNVFVKLQRAERHIFLLAIRQMLDSNSAPLNGV